MIKCYTYQKFLETLPKREEHFLIISPKMIQVRLLDCSKNHFSNQDYCITVVKKFRFRLNITVEMIIIYIYLYCAKYIGKACLRIYMKNDPYNVWSKATVKL